MVQADAEQTEPGWPTLVPLPDDHSADDVAWLVLATIAAVCTAPSTGPQSRWMRVRTMRFASDPGYDVDPCSVSDSVGTQISATEAAWQAGDDAPPPDGTCESLVFFDEASGAACFRHRSPTMTVLRAPTDATPAGVTAHHDRAALLMYSAMRELTHSTYGAMVMLDAAPGVASLITQLTWSVIWPDQPIRSASVDFKELSSI